MNGDWCERCGAQNCRVKTTEIQVWPQTLVLGIKRFEQDPRTGRRRKLGTRVAFDIVLPLPGAPAFTLRGLVKHEGSFEGGHYTGAVRARDDRWFFCDDSAQPREVPWNEVQRMQAYILVYER